MAKAVFRPSLMMSVAHFFTDSLKGVLYCKSFTLLKMFKKLFSHAGEILFPLVWEVIKTLELYSIPMVSLTSDGVTH